MTAGRSSPSVTLSSKRKILAQPLRAAVFGGSRAALCRRLHLNLGPRHIDRPAASGAGAAPPAGKPPSDAQLTTARINRHLSDMGVDPALWLHALDTPPRALYYFSAEELERYGLVTGSAPVAEARS